MFMHTLVRKGLILAIVVLFATISVVPGVRTSGKGKDLFSTNIAPDKQWDRMYGGDGWDEGRSVQQTNDGGYIITGSTLSYGAGNSDVWLIKTDPYGNEEWNKTFGGKDDDYGYSVQQTSDGGYIIVGCTFSYGSGDSDVWLIKTDSYGNEVWNRTFGGSNRDGGYCVQQTSDGGFVIVGIAGKRGGDVWLIKTDRDGNEEWNKTFGGPDLDCGYSIQQTDDGGYIIAGCMFYYGAFNSDIWLIKTDSYGNEMWNRTFGGKLLDCGYSVEQTSDGGYIIAGYKSSYGAGCDIWIIKTDGSGNDIWNHTFGGEDMDYGYSVQQTSDGGYVIVGSIGSYGVYCWEDVWLIKIDEYGNEMWNRTFGGEDEDCGYSVQQTSDGGYIIVGCGTYKSHDVWLIKVAPEDKQPPAVKIVKPEKAIYFNNTRIIPFFIPVVIGSIDIVVNATDENSGVDHVEFYVDDRFKANDFTTPYSWTWSEGVFGMYTIKVVAYDNAGNQATTEIKVWRLF